MLGGVLVVIVGKRVIGLVVFVVVGVEVVVDIVVVVVGVGSFLVALVVGVGFEVGPGLLVGAVVGVEPGVCAF